MNAPPLYIFVIRFTDDATPIPYGWLKKNEIDACAEVRTWNKDRPVEVTRFEIVGLAALMKGSWQGDVFLALWLKQLHRREAEIRAEERTKKEVSP